MKFASLWLSGVMLLVFILQQLIGTQPFVLDTSLTAQQPWRIVLSLFAHSGIVHLLGNMFSLSFFGLILEGRLDGRRVLWIFLLGGILLNLFPLYARSLGASGGAFVVVGVLVAPRPFFTVWMNFVPMPMIVAGIAMFFAGFGYQAATGANVAHLTHLAGLLVGIIVGLYYRHKGFGDALSFKRTPAKPTISDKEFDEWENTYMKQ